MNETCQNCGAIKEGHIDALKFLGNEINEHTMALLQNEVRLRIMRFGECCFNYKRDNLKYLEGLANDR